MEDEITKMTRASIEKNKEQFLSSLKELAFADRLRAFRIMFGITGEALAERLGTTPQHIYKMESGKTSPGVDTLQRFSALIGASGDEMLSALRKE